MQDDIFDTDTWLHIRKDGLVQCNLNEFKPLTLNLNEFLYWAQQVIGSGRLSLHDKERVFAVRDYVVKLHAGNDYIV